MIFWIFIIILILIPLYFSIKALIKNYRLAFVNRIENRKGTTTWFVVNIILSAILLGAVLFIIYFLYLASSIQC